MCHSEIANEPAQVHKSEDLNSCRWSFTFFLLLQFCIVHNKQGQEVQSTRVSKEYADQRMFNLCVHLTQYQALLVEAM